MGITSQLSVTWEGVNPLSVNVPPRYFIRAENQEHRSGGIIVRHFISALFIIILLSAGGGVGYLVAELQTGCIVWDRMLYLGRVLQYFSGVYSLRGVVEFSYSDEIAGRGPGAVRRPSPHRSAPTSLSSSV